VLWFSAPHFTCTFPVPVSETCNADAGKHRWSSWPFPSFGGGHELGIDKATLPRLERDRAETVIAEVARIPVTLVNVMGPTTTLVAPLFAHGDIMVGAKPDPRFTEIDTGGEAATRELTTWPPASVAVPPALFVSLSRRP